MADVNQSLGFDASQAVRSLEQLSFTIDTVNQSIRTMSTTAKGDPTKTVRDGALATEKTLRRLTRNVELLRRELINTGNAGKKSGNDITLSWNTVARVLQTQVLIRGLNELQRQFIESANAAREFELSVSRITTIAGDELAAGTDSLSLSLRNLAIDLGRPIEEVSSAAFQTLQNDVGDVTESLEFLRKSAQLATVQGGDLESTMNALTSIFKVYGEEAGNVNDVADAFFVAVDKGRITIEDFGQKLGTAIGPANQLGLSVDQVLASVAALTQTGLDSSTALTQYRNIILKLVKPTEDLEEAFRDLGVTSGTELIEKFNGDLLPALQGLQQVLGGTEQDVARAFNTIRGQLGVFNLLSDEGSLFADILDAFPEKAGKFADALEKVEQTDAREFERELAQLNDTILTLGETTASIQLTGLTFLNDLIPDAKTATAAITGLGIATVAAFARSTIAAKGFQVALAGIGPAALLSAGAIGGLAFLAVNAFPNASAEIQEASREAARLAAEIESGENVRVAAARQETSAISEQLDAQTDKYRDFFATLDGLYADDTAKYEERTARIGETGRRLVEDFVESREDLLSRVDDALGEVDNRIEKSIGRYEDAQQRLDDLRFENSIAGVDKLSEATARLARSQQTAQQAQAAFAQAGTNEQLLDRARELQRTAERQAAAAARAAERTDNLSLASQARANQEQIVGQALEQEASLKNRLESIDTDRLGIARDQLALDVQREKALAEQEALLTSDVDSEGIRKSEQQRVRDAQQLLKVEKERKAVSAAIAASPVIEAFGLQDLERQAAAAFERGIAQIQLDTTAAAAELEAAITEKTYGIELQIVNPDIVTAQVQEIFNQTANLPVADRLATRQQLLKQLVEQQASAQETLVTSEEKFNNASQSINKFIEAAAAGRPTLKNLELGLAQLDASFASFFGNDSFQQELDRLLESDLSTSIGREIVGLSNQLSSQGGAALGEVNTQIDALETRLTNLGTSGALTNAEVRALTQALTQLQTQSEQIAARTRAQEIIDPDAAREALVLLQNQGQTYDRLKGQIGQAETEADGVKNAVQSTNTPLAQAEAFWTRIEAITARAKANAQGVVPPGAGADAAGLFYGGQVVHRAAGGDLTRGQDQTLVAAKEGEFITSARNSQRFFAELRAINSGRAPIFREQGGPVTNVGDINVNIDARNAQTVDGRQIARQLKRELRRGSSSL